VLQINDTIISLDLFNEHFQCDIATCKGICCVEGDAGAPLSEEEVALMQELLPEIWDDLTPAAQEVINKQGVSYIDEDGEPVTSIINGGECVFTYFDDMGICGCVFERAYNAGRIAWKKPISCHLYPVRLQKYHDFTAVNYHQWSVCNCARQLGQKKGIPVYRFLKEPLIRRFGEEWWEQLDTAYRMQNEGCL
jgi:hypothetical protein